MSAFCEARNRGIEQYLRNNAKAKKGGKATEKLTTTKGQREKKTSKKQDANRLGARKNLKSKFKFKDRQDSWPKKISGPTVTLLVQSIIMI